MLIFLKTTAVILAAVALSPVFAVLGIWFIVHYKIRQRWPGGYPARRRLRFVVALVLVATPAYLWTVAYIKAHSTPYDRAVLTSIVRVEGNAFMIYVGKFHRAGEADTTEQPNRSELQLYEDGVLLGPAHTPHHEIISLGSGRYSHWMTSDPIVMFSASDNSDPRKNGRVYRITIKSQ